MIDPLIGKIKMWRNASEFYTAQPLFA